MDRWVRERFHPSLPLGEGGQRVTASKEHIKVSREAAMEGMVLLKNDGGVLPLPKGSKVALFGKGTFDYVKGGGGSGDVTVPYVKNLYDGLSAYPEEVSLFDGTARFYQSYVTECYRQGGIPGMIREPELPDVLLQAAANFADTAIVSISRFSGEGWDRKSDYGAPGDYACDDNETIALENEIFSRGDFYLTDAEQALVNQVLSRFRRIVVVLNVGGVVDSSWFADEPRINAVFLAWQGGMEGGAAEAELILGHRNFSGKLADTFAGSLSDYPSTASFHESGSYVNYTEDIYVGYRYFETLPGEAAKVSYPFGFGLSYTDFAISPEGGKAHRHEHRGLPGARGGAALLFRPAGTAGKARKAARPLPQDGTALPRKLRRDHIHLRCLRDGILRRHRADSEVLLGARAGRLCTVPWHGCAKCQEANLCLSPGRGCGDRAPHLPDGTSPAPLPPPRRRKL